MRFESQVWPVSKPIYPEDKSRWAPIIPVQLAYKHTTRRVEAWIDSGSDHCMFHAGLCKSLGIKRLEAGVYEPVYGIVGSHKADMYFHKVKIIVGSERFETMVGFSWEINCSLLGIRGFFENFKVAFDSSETPPIIDLERIRRA